MKTNFKKPVLLTTFAVFYTVLVKVCDVKPIGPDNSLVGLASINSFVNRIFPVNILWYKITNGFGLVAIAICALFGFVGFLQLVKRKSFLKVDQKNIDDLLDSITNKSVVNIKYLRNDKLYNTQLKLYKDNNEYKTGLYVKDSIMGIGTLTYIDPETKIFGALGHEITDKNTNDIVKINNGNIFESKVTSIDKSYNGTPGSKNAKFNFQN